ncbi:MAG TPA: hypothetical protein PLH64_04530 [Anaerolineaceae bacterium]|nr:hypothetical protein [Anaerolineaceae bacterium]
MSWRVFLTDRTPVMGLKPLSLCWGAIGGPQQAILGLQNDLHGFEEMQSWLGSGVEIYDPSDRLAWWGYVDRVNQPVGTTELEASLEELANRVAVRYRSMEPGKDYGAIAQTDWKDDLTSQEIYGIKELLLEREVLSEEQALLLRDASLRRLALPVSKLLPSTKASRSQVICRGWFERMRWRQWPAHTDILGHSPSQQGYQALGATLKQKSLAQSCIFQDAVKVASMSVRIRKIGAPQDQVRFQLQTDALGQPSGIIRAEQTLAASAVPSESYGWVSVGFAAPCAVTANERLWLVVTRDGAVSSTAYFCLGLDESLGFSVGNLLLLDASLSQWRQRAPDADLLFKLNTLSDSVELMAQAVQSSGCFNDFSYEAGAGMSLPYVSEAGMDCQVAFLELLSLGTPELDRLLVEVNSKRQLRVFPQPAPGSPVFWLGKDGSIKNEVGKDLEPAWRAVGNWLTSETRTACFLENLRLDTSAGSYQLRANTMSSR